MVKRIPRKEHKVVWAKSSVVCHVNDRTLCPHKSTSHTKLCCLGLSVALLYHDCFCVRKIPFPKDFPKIAKKPRLTSLRKASFFFPCQYAVTLTSPEIRENRRSFMLDNYLVRRASAAELPKINSPDSGILHGEPVDHNGQPVDHNGQPVDHNGRSRSQSSETGLKTVPSVHSVHSEPLLRTTRSLSRLSGRASRSSAYLDDEAFQEDKETSDFTLPLPTSVSAVKLKMDDLRNDNFDEDTWTRCQENQEKKMWWFSNDTRSGNKTETFLRIFFMSRSNNGRFLPFWWLLLLCLLEWHVFFIVYFYAHLPPHPCWFVFMFFKIPYLPK